MPPVAVSVKAGNTVQNKPRAGMDSIRPAGLLRPTDTDNIDKLLILLIVGMAKMYNLLSGAVFTRAGRRERGGL